MQNREHGKSLCRDYKVAGGNCFVVANTPANVSERKDDKPSWVAGWVSVGPKEATDGRTYCGVISPQGIAFSLYSDKSVDVLLVNANDEFVSRFGQIDRDAVHATLAFDELQFGIRMRVQPGAKRRDGAPSRTLFGPVPNELVDAALLAARNSRAVTVSASNKQPVGTFSLKSSGKALAWAEECALGAPTIGEIKPVVNTNASVLTELDLKSMRAQVQRCWNIPVVKDDAEELYDLKVSVQFQLAPDGNLIGQPKVVKGGGDTGIEKAAAEAAMRAVIRCAPYKLPPEKYASWATIIVAFDPSEMF